MAFPESIKLDLINSGLFFWLYLAALHELKYFFNGID